MHATDYRRHGRGAGRAVAVPVLGLILGFGPGALAGDPAGWQLVWSDEFDGPVVDPGRWRIADKPGDTNNELQYYAPDEVYLEGGALVLRSRERVYGGRQYTSGLVSTRERFAQMYGRVEVRAQLPGTQGLWPAHWMLPVSGAWPPEIDIMELKGQHPRTVYMTHHWGSWPNVQSNGGTFSGPDFTDGYHTFAVEWSPGRIRWLVDDVVRFESNNQHVPAEPMYVILNTAVGGNFVGPPNDGTVFPQHHRIDYVRVYTREDPGHGLARIVDVTRGGAAPDGSIEPDEYVATLAGINDGFGDRIGRGSVLGLDSDCGGWLCLSTESASPWLPGDTAQGVVMYFDTRRGGFTSTTSMIDNVNRGRALASGRARIGGEQVDLYFADGFAADFALILEAEEATLLELDPTFHNYVAGAALGADTDHSGGDAIRYHGDRYGTAREVRLRMSDIAVDFGAEVRLFATLLDADDGDRSNEYVGVPSGHWFDQQPVTRADVQLGTGSFLTFVTTEEFCPADVNQDGAVDVRDVLQFLTWWAAGDDRADIVHDGLINTLDVLAFLALWNDPCA